MNVDGDPNIGSLDINQTSNLKKIKQTKSNDNLRQSRRTPSCTSLDKKQATKFYFDLKTKLDGCDIKAKLLETPCLTAAYKLGNIELYTTIAQKSKLSCTLHRHCLSFECDDFNPQQQQQQQQQRQQVSTYLNLSHSYSDSMKKSQQQQTNPITRKTDFDLPGVKVDGTYYSKVISELNKQVNLTDLKLNVKISQLCHELNAEVIAQLVFVAKVFIKEINHILQAVYSYNFNNTTIQTNVQHQRVRGSSATIKLQPQILIVQQQQLQQQATAVLSRIYYNVQIEVGKISLTAITPSHTSLNICNGDKTIVFLTNISQTAKESINKKSTSRKTKPYHSHQASISNQQYTIKPFIEANCHICIDLKTCFKQKNNDLYDLNKQQTQPVKGASAALNVPLQQSSPHSKSGIGLINLENELDWYQLALFDTKFDLRNEINLNDDKETIIINVDKPRFFLQPGAIDNSLSFYLNYKSTYDFWLDKRQQFANIFVDKNQLKNLTTKTTKQASTPTANSGGGVDSLVLMLKLSVKNLGLALPLSNKMTKDFKTNTDCLIITLDDTSLDAYYSDCVVTRGKFNNFCLRFAENLDLTSSNWLPADMIKINSNMNRNQRIFDNAGHKSKVLFNSWIVPYGSYKICSSTIHSLLDSVKHNRDVTNRPIWNLSVVWNMEGIDVNLDTTIGKWFSKFAATITRLTETQYTTEDPNQSKERETELRVLKNKLHYYKDCGDEENANEIRLKIDRIVLANYPDKLKKTLAKTRDNFKGQLGFTTSPSVNKSKNVSTQQTSQLNYNNTMAEKELNALNLQPSSSHHARSKSDVYFKKGHSISNEDTKLDSINENRFTSNGTQDEKVGSIQTSTTNEELARSSNTQLAQSVDIKLDVRIDINSGRCVFHNTIASIRSSPKSDHQNDHYHNKQHPQHHSRVKSTSSTTSSGSTVSNNSTSIIDDYYCYQFENHSNHDQNKNTVFIFPAICVKAYYDESTNTEQNNRLFKRANLYSIIKIEKFAMPTNQTGNASYAFYNKPSIMKEMVISPALLDFLEQTLEPLDGLLKSHTNNELNKKRVKTSKVNNDRSRTVSFNNTKTIINDNTKNNNGENEHIEFDLNSANEDNEDEITEFSDSDEYDNNEDDDDNDLNQNNIDDDDTSIDKNETLKPSNKSRNKIRTTYKKNKKVSTTTSPPITTIHFPIDFVVIISMLPSDVRFTCTPSSMECLFKLPSIEMVFSSKSHRSVQLLKQQQSLQLNELDEDSAFENLNKDTNSKTTTNNNKNNNKTLKLNNNDNISSAGLSVTCCLSDLSIIFYNRLGIKTSTDTKYIKSDERHYDEKDSLSVRVGYIKLNICRTHRLIDNTITNNNPCHDVKLSVIADIGGSSFTYGIRNIKEVFVFPKYWYRSSLARRLFLGEESSSQATTEAGDNVNNDNLYSSGQNNNNNNNNNSNKNSNETNKRILRKQKYKSDHHLNIHDWKTLVLISINLAELEVKMNFGNVLGDVTWVSKKAKSASKIAINSHGKRKMEFNFILDYSKLTSDGSTNPIVLRIQDISSFVTFDDEDLDLRSPHKIDLNIYAIECTIGSTFNPTTYMMGCRLSNLCVKLNDVRNPRNVEQTNSEAFVKTSGFNDEERNFASSSYAENKIENSHEEESKLRKIIVELCVSWDQFHLMITSSTTSDLIVLYYRLYEYIERQFAEGKDYIKSWDLDLFYEVKTKQFNSPNEKTKELNKRNFYVPGGNIRLNGNNFTLITFSGTNFKVKQWAIFSLNEPSLDFCVDKQILLGDKKEEKYVTYPEQLFFNLGLNYLNPERKRTNKSGQNMASIYIVSRESSSLITQLHTINDWFEYAHYGIEAFGLRDFPRFYTDLEHTQEVKKLKITEQIKYDEVFHIPSLNLYFTSTLIKNVVKFRLNVTFHDHILTTYSVQNFHFLYQLIVQYMNERKRIEVKQPIPSSTDGRTFECVDWELDPTLKLISKYGSMDSFGIDSLLKHLGVKHAKVTIPKWLQAGLMDSANGLLQNIIKAYIKVVPDDQ